jgi:hypothetical protein
MLAGTDPNDPTNYPGAPTPTPTVTPTPIPTPVVTPTPTPKKRIPGFEAVFATLSF